MCWKLLDCSSRMASGWSFGFRFKLHILYVLISTNPESSFPLVHLQWSSLCFAASICQQNPWLIISCSLLRFQHQSTLANEKSVDTRSGTELGKGRTAPKQGVQNPKIINSATPSASHSKSNCPVPLQSMHCPVVELEREDPFLNLGHITRIRDWRPSLVSRA